MCVRTNGLMECNLQANLKKRTGCLVNVVMVDDKLDKILELIRLDLLIDQNDLNISLLTYHDKLENFFKNKPISIPSNLSGKDIAEHINKQRLNFLESFQFE